MSETKVLNHGLVRLVDHMGPGLIEPIVLVAAAALKEHVLAEL